MKDTLASELSPAFCSILWESLRASLAAVAIGGAYFLALHRGRGRVAEWWLFLTIDVALAVAAIGFSLIRRRDSMIPDYGFCGSSRRAWRLAWFCSRDACSSFASGQAWCCCTAASPS